MLPKKGWRLLAMLTLVLMLHLESEALSEKLSPKVGTPWAGSPMALLVSRWIYWRSQTDWHYGLVPETYPFGQSFDLRLQEKASPRLPWAGWLLRTERHLQPSVAWAHRSGESRREQEKDGVVLVLLKIALWFDPAYSRVYLDKAYIENRIENLPRVGARTLMEGLARVHRPSSRLALLNDLFFLRYYRLQDRPQAYQLLIVA